MNMPAFNCMMSVMSGVCFNIWFWAMRPWAGWALFGLLVFWLLGYLTRGRVPKK